MDTFFKNKVSLQSTQFRISLLVFYFVVFPLLVLSFFVVLPINEVSATHKEWSSNAVNDAACGSYGRFRAYCKDFNTHANISCTVELSCSYKINWGAGPECPQCTGGVCSGVALCSPVSGGSGTAVCASCWQIVNVDIDAPNYSRELWVFEWCTYNWWTGNVTFYLNRAACETGSWNYCSGNTRVYRDPWGNWCNTAACTANSRYCSGGNVWQTNTGCSGGNCYNNPDTKVQNCTPNTSYCSGPNRCWTNTGCWGGACYNNPDTCALDSSCNVNPEGWHDGNSGPQEPAGCIAGGWANDNNNENIDLNVRILSDGGQVANGVASSFRGDLTGVCPGGTCAFTFSLWGLISLNVNHTITAQAQDPQTGTWVNLSGTPKTLLCENQPPVADASVKDMQPFIGSWGKSVTISNTEPELQVGTTTDLNGDGQGTYDPDEGPITLTCEWDFDSDGVFDYTTGCGTEDIPSDIENPTLFYQTQPLGTYTATLRVTDSAGATALDTVTINKTSSPPTATDLNIPPTSDYCFYPSPPIILNWTYSDPDDVPPLDTDPQSAYQVQVDNDSDFSSPEVDSGKVISASTSYSPPGLSFSTTYFWRVMVWDSSDTPSTFATGLSFSTLSRPPRPDFTCNDQEDCSAVLISEGEIVAIEDTSDLYAGFLSRLWTLPLGTTLEPGFTSADSPIEAKFAEGDNQPVTLTVTDTSGYCETTKYLNVAFPLPEWKEIPPAS